MNKNHLAALAVFCAGAACAADRIVTGPDRATQVEIGHDLSRLIAQPAGIELDVEPSKGSIENLRRLRTEPGVRLALVQSDVYRAMRDQVSAGDVEAGRLIRPLRALLPLFDEELYFVVRADSPMKHIGDIRGKRINVGELGGGTALTATTVYRTIFNSQPDEGKLSYLSNEQALLKLATDKSIDVVVVVAGQPARLFSEMTPQARNFIKLLPLDPDAPSSSALRNVYGEATIRADSYSQWLRADVRTLAVKSLLVTYDYQAHGTRDVLVRFAKSLCTNFDRLQAEGHSKWRETRLGQPPLAKGWSYYSATTEILSSCGPARPSVAIGSGKPSATPLACTRERAVLGLCNAAGAK
ncbi:TAXI family TRAP transporter solute-binding subunit [Paucibacter sp. PLA-PC-4]|uniref:TAXI family TRAP transporter solute-binding subunit n=1 Tax=Paucibacter sp. PLA-PC-4 TaxID=2993655 RepID=UPI00224B808C|nr:TAXI family TRAP transporter solute-binding subunit [Paucibacter sp. PLA-PC-4]MCX2865585.1 TAXI family TRAP transporter solute-binding subunit [Paucibacter sp. PLA-PC-4]